MLHKTRSTQTAMMKYGLIAPLFMLMIVVSSATLASKQLAKIEEKVEEFSEGNLEEVVVKPTKTAREVLSEANIDLSDALIISPALVDEVKRVGEIKRDTVYNGVDQQAEYPGGMEEFGKYLAKNIKYPAAAQRANIQGKVYTEFIINKDGSASDFKVLRGIGFGCDEEAMRVIKSVARWNPGRHKEEIVRSSFVVPINFILEGEPTPKIDKNDKEELPKLPAVMEVKPQGETIMNFGNIAITDNSKTGLNNSKNVVYVMNGKRVSEIALKGIAPNDIEKLEVYKGENAVVRYGEDAREGAIVITLKKK